MSHDELRREARRLRSPLVLRGIEDFYAGQRLPLDSVACLGLEAAAQFPTVVNL